MLHGNFQQNLFSYCSDAIKVPPTGCGSDTSFFFTQIVHEHVGVEACVVSCY